jgi:hypothetical protein
VVRQRTTDVSRATLNVKESSPVAVCFRSARCQQTINLIQGRLEMPGKSRYFSNRSFFGKTSKMENMVLVFSLSLESPMVIIMCVTVSVAVVSAARGLEGRSYGGKIRSKLVEHIFDRIVGSDAKSLVSKFSR